MEQKQKNIDQCLIFYRILSAVCTVLIRTLHLKGNLEHKMCEPQEAVDYSVGPSRSGSGEEIQDTNIKISAQNINQNSTV